jgi:putative membrane protein
MSRLLVLAAALAMTTGAAFAHDSQLSDPQIAHIAYTAGQIDVDAAKLALAKTKNAEVRDFAELMARDHAAVNEKALSLVKRLNVKPEANGTSAGLTKQAAQAEKRLRKLSGAAFDRAYIANEIAYHRTVNQALSTALIPGAHNGELKALLESGLALFTAHQTHAEHLAQTVK